MKNNKNTKIKTRFAIELFVASTIVFATFSAACSVIGGFTRSTAANLIEKDNRFKAPSTMTIDIGWHLTNAGAGIAQMSADETAEQAIPRAKEDFMQRQPQLLVAEQLGYIKLYFENGELGERPMGAPRFDNNLKHWFFKPRAEITEKGRSLWKDLNLKEDEENLPLAVRGSAEITGLKDENPHMKSAEFTYRWEATDLGKAFDPNTGEFKKLPQNLQEALQKTQRNIFGTGGNNVADYGSKRTGRAFFQKFDDGFRIGEMFFF